MVISILAGRSIEFEYNMMELEPIGIPTVIVQDKILDKFEMAPDYAMLKADNIDDFKGLGREHPWFALLTMILMLSMAGVPPFLGFWAKWAVLRELIASGHTWLAVVAVGFSVIGLYYYLRIVRYVYFDEAEGEVTVTRAQDLRVMLSSNALLILVLGIYPGALMGVCVAALS